MCSIDERDSQIGTIPQTGGPTTLRSLRTGLLNPEWREGRLDQRRTRRLQVMQVAATVEDLASRSRLRVEIDGRAGQAYSGARSH